ncbi:MAG: heme exporter protein D [Lentisphaeria bacterium]|jgi:heme exporter protein D
MELVFQFDSLSEFLSMKGHGQYVWLAYGVTILAFVNLVVFHKLARKKFFKMQQSIARRT